MTAPPRPDMRTLELLDYDVSGQAYDYILWLEQQLVMLENMEEGEDCSKCGGREYSELPEPPAKEPECHYHEGPHIYAHIAHPKVLVCKCGAVKHPGPIDKPEKEVPSICPECKTTLYDTNGNRACWRCGRLFVPEKEGE